jgi:hypothetical protein
MNDAKIYKPIRVTNWVLEKHAGVEVLRGLIAGGSLGDLRYDTYQRELLPARDRAKIIGAVEKREDLPDIELGMRGGRYELTPARDVLLLDPVYVIDGQQRAKTLLSYLARDKGARSLGAKIFFDTTVEWERDRFHVLNADRVRVSQNVLLRNLKEKSDLLATLYGLSLNRDFAMADKVCWDQHLAAKHLITAQGFVRLALLLHSHLVRASGGNKIQDVLRACETAGTRVGIGTVRANVLTFWQLVAKAWGIPEKRPQRHTAPAVWMRATFLQVLVRVLVNHRDFWVSANELKIPDDLRRKIAAFDISDPETERLTGSFGKAMDILYFQLVTHINSGKRTKRLTPRHGDAMGIGLDADQSDDDGLQPWDGPTIEPRKGLPAALH